MKEIDFLPEWYKSGRRRQTSFRAQYIALGGMFVVMLAWGLVASRSVSKHRATLAKDEPKIVAAKTVAEEFDRIKTKITELRGKAELLEKIDSKIDVANVLAEISFLIGEKIVLSKVQFEAERLDSLQLKPTTYKSIRSAKQHPADEGFLSEVRFKVLIGGVAVDAGEVAKLVCRLEDSPYFCSVYPSFSRNTEIKAGAARYERQDAKNQIRSVSEFEIACYLANYRQQRPNLAKQM